MSEWKTIDSAPKDGTEILVTDGCRSAVAKYDNESEAYPNARWYISDWHNDPIHLRGGYSATHWMPLPEPPK